MRFNIVSIIEDSLDFMNETICHVAPLINYMFMSSMMLAEGRDLRIRTVQDSQVNSYADAKLLRAFRCGKICADATTATRPGGMEDSEFGITVASYELNRLLPQLPSRTFRQVFSRCSMINR
jgi:hypothetical protein